MGGQLKVTDLDDASPLEAACSPRSAPQACTLQFPARNFTLPCSGGRCEDINEKRNLYNAYRWDSSTCTSLQHLTPPVKFDDFTYTTLHHL